MKTAEEFLKDMGYDVNDISWIVKLQDGSNADTIALIQKYGNYLHREFNKKLRNIQNQLHKT